MFVNIINILKKEKQTKNIRLNCNFEGYLKLKNSTQKTTTKYAELSFLSYSNINNIQLFVSILYASVAPLVSVVVLNARTKLF